MNTIEKLMMMTEGGQQFIPFSDTFVRSDGTLGSDWIGITGAISGNKTVITPTVDPTERLVNPGFETSDPPATWGKLGSPPTYERSNVDVHEGTYALHVITNAASQGAYQGPTLTKGNWYKYSGWMKKISGTPYIQANPSHWKPGSADYAGVAYAAQFKHSGELVENGSRAYLYCTAAAAAEFYADTMSITGPIATASMFAYINRPFKNAGAIKAQWNISPFNPAGVIGWWDGVADKQNCIMAYCDGAFAGMWKYVGTTLTQLIAPTAIVYGDGYSVEIRRLPGTNTFQLWYAGSQVGTNVTVSDSAIINNTHFGIFSSDSGSTCNAVYVNPSGYVPKTAAFIDDPIYVALLGIESSMLTDGNRLDMWYDSGESGNLKYAYTTDPALLNWTVNDVTINSPCLFDYVSKNPDDGLYYLCYQKAYTDYEVYMASSPDKVTWTPINSGNPVFTHDPNAANYFSVNFNCSFLFKDGTIHFVIGGTKIPGSSYKIGYATSTLAAGPNFNTNITAITPPGGDQNPDLRYVAERDVWLLFTYGTYPGQTGGIFVWRALGSSDLTLVSSWLRLKTFSFGFTDCYACDPSVCELPPYFNWRSILSYNYDQTHTNGVGRTPSTLSQAFNSRTLAQIYDELIREV
jgi:hypothetical protein